MNPLSIIIAAVAGMVIGALWYGPIFGKAWIRLQGFTKKDFERMKKDPKIQKQMKRNYALAFLGQLVMATALSFIIDQIGAAEINEGVAVGAIAWLGFIATTMLNKVLWESKTWRLYFLDASHYLVVLVVMGAILSW